jgi:hypothetical protein
MFFFLDDSIDHKQVIFSVVKANYLGQILFVESISDASGVLVGKECQIEKTGCALGRGPYNHDPPGPGPCPLVLDQFL